MLSVSSRIEGLYGLPEVCLSLPSVINQNGIERVLQLPLDESERAALQKSAGIIREAIDSLDLPAHP